MKIKKTVTALLAVLMVFSLSSAVMAYDVKQIDDTTGIISDEEQELLNDTAY